MTNARRKVEVVKGTAAELASGNSIFPLGFYIFETDTAVVKRANGIATYNALPDINGEQVYTAAEKTKVANISGTNTGDETATSIISKIGDGTKISATYLPSFVDDVLEYANAAARPATGAAGILYVTLDDNKVYRWGGSAYAEISASPGSTDAVTEGATNKYWTNARTIGSTLTGYAKAAVAAAIGAGDSILIAIGKLEKLLDGKQANLVSGTNIRTVGGNSLLGSTDIPFPVTNITNAFYPQDVTEQTYAVDDNRLRILGTRGNPLEKILRSWGSKYVAETPLLRIEDSATQVLTSGRSVFSWIYLDVETIVNNLCVYMRTQGNYTPSGSNGMALYKFDPTTKIATRVALTADTPNAWTAAALTLVKLALTAPYTAAPGWYFIGVRFEASATVTPPAIAGKALPVSNMYNMLDVPLLWTTSGTAWPTTQDLTSGTLGAAGGVIIWGAIEKV